MRDMRAGVVTLALLFTGLVSTAVHAAPQGKLPPHLNEKRYKNVLSTLFKATVYSWSALKKDAEEVRPYIEYILGLSEIDDRIVESAILYACEALTKYDCKKLVDPTVSYLTHENWHIKAESLMVLREIGIKEDSPAVAILLHAESEYNRVGAALTLAQIGGRRELFVLDQWLTLNDNHYAVAEAKKARDALRERLEKEAKAKPVEPTEADQTVARFADADPKVRAAAVEALKKVGTRADSSAVVALLHDPDATVRAAAADWLGAVGGKRELVALETRLREPKAVDDEAFDAFAKAKKAVAERVEAGEKTPKAPPPPTGAARK